MTLFLVTALMAAPITKEQARQQAMQFLMERHGVQAARGMSLSVQPSATTDAASYYVFNVGGNEGFVLVSGDDRVSPVLGYADEGSFCQEQMPANLRIWLEGYQRQVEWLEAQGIQHQPQARQLRKASVRTSISPLLTTRWDQGTPYNNLCPLNDKDVHTVTGCVATAVSQLLYYYGKPAATTAVIPAYTTTKLGLNIAQKEITTLQWELMQESHTAGTTDEEDNAVATLMALVGAAFKMDYNTEFAGGSAAVADLAPDVLAKYFGYDPDAKMVYRNDYTYSDWIDLIYHQLKNGNPVFYNGQSAGGGHAFLCDGYDEDDYFHINWGWGGRSNGYYRLSVLLPEEQGAGGSKNLSAFSFDQGVMVNVKPQDDGIDETGRTLLTASTTQAVNPTYSRTTTTDDFLNVAFYTLFYNMTGSAQTFDVGLGLFDEDDQLLQVLWQTELGELNYLAGYGYTTYATFGSSLADGIYRIKNISRLHGSEAWTASYDSGKHYVTATIEGTGLTLESLNVSDNSQSKLSATLALEGTAVKGKDTRVVATVTNNGTGLYTGNLKLIRQSDEDYYLLAGTQVDIEAGATISVPFTFKPANAGTYNIILWDKATKNVAVSPLPVEVSVGEEAVNANLTYVKTVLRNGDLETGQVFGSSVKATVTLRNNDSKNHTGGIFVRLFTWTPTGEGGYSGSSNVYQTVDVTIPAGETKDVDFEFKGLEPNTLYSFRYNYTDDIYDQVGIGSSEMFQSAVGISTYYADGTSTIMPPQSEVTVPDDVVAIDMSGVAVTSITPNANPNTLYIFGPDDEVPASLNTYNVVKGGTATQLSLSDGYDFFSPVAFTAATATYTRRFTVGADGTRGWSTIVVPFNVDWVRSGEKAIDWFHRSTDTGKNFWLKEFSSETEGVVYFNFADALKAYIPYIIAVPGNKWGSSWNLTNRDITFGGSNVSIPADAKASVNANRFKLVGTTTAQEANDAYMLNAEGTAFEKTTGTLNAFRACFKSVAFTSGSVLTIASEGQQTQGVNDIQTETTGSSVKVFGLDGRRIEDSILQRGIYIIDGRKVIK